MEKSIDVRINEKFKEQREQFLYEINSMFRQGFEYDSDDSRKVTPTFSILEMVDYSYYTNSMQELFFEWRVREILINKMFEFLFKEYGHDIRFGKSTIGTSTLENEEMNGVEFFLVENGKYIAFRYTRFSKDYSIPQNLPQNFYLNNFKSGVKEIEKWYCIDWQGLDENEILHLNKTYDPKGFQTIISLNDLFDKYFPGYDSASFISSLKEIIGAARKEIGFFTAPKIVPSNLSIFKKLVVENLSGVDKLKYQKVTQKGEITSIEDPMDLSTAGNDLVDDFYEYRILALVGKSKFAQSYVSSEYMYNIFAKDVSFDYTAVICGYIKSIEQLCETIIYDVIPKQNLNIYYKARPLKKWEITELEEKNMLKRVTVNKNVMLYVLMKDGNQKYFSELTMGQQFAFLKENSDVIFRIADEKLKHKIFDCIENYVSFDRNGFFHKHNISDFRIVERIRNNTQILLFWLLGSLNLPKAIDMCFDFLGILDYSFDELFRKVVFRHSYCYQLDFGNGIVKKAIRNWKNPSVEFDENGMICNTELKFIEVDVYPKNYKMYCEFLSDYNSSKEIVVNRNYLPYIVSIIDSDGNAKMIYNNVAYISK